MKLISLYIILFAVNFSSCKFNSSPPPAKTISVSILPQKFFVDAISGSKIFVNVMIPPGASHSSYEPTARQLNSLVSSQAFLKIGHLDFEYSWMPRFAGVNPSMKIFDLSKGIELIKGSYDHQDGNNSAGTVEDKRGIDPHIWMSPACVRTIALNTLNSLISIYPEDSSEFHKNYKNLLVQIEEIESLFNRNAEKLKGLSFIIYHPALAYLARDYKMEQIVLEFDGKEPPPAHIRKIIDLAKDRNIHTIFVQKQFSIDNSRSLAKEINAEIIRIDPMDEDWPGQMRSIADKLTGSR